MATGVLIGEYLKSVGVTQTFISRKTGIALSKLNLALNGRRRLTLDEYERICGALDVNTDRFLTPRKMDFSPRHYTPPRYGATAETTTPPR